MTSEEKFWADINSALGLITRGLGGIVAAIARYKLAMRVNHVDPRTSSATAVVIPKTVMAEEAGSTTE